MDIALQLRKRATYNRSRFAQIKPITQRHHETLLVNLRSGESNTVIPGKGRADQRRYLLACVAAAGESQEKIWSGSPHASDAPKHMSSSASLRHHRQMLPPPLATQSSRVVRSRHPASASARPDPPTLPLLFLAGAAAAAQTKSSVSTSSAADLAPAMRRETELSETVLDDNRRDRSNGRPVWV